MRNDMVWRLSLLFPFIIQAQPNPEMPTPLIFFKTVKPYLIQSVRNDGLLYTGCATGSENPAVFNAAYEQEVLDRVNIERKNNSLPPLKSSANLIRAARYHCYDMNDDDYYFGDSPPPSAEPPTYNPHNTYDRNGANELIYACSASSRFSAFFTAASIAENIGIGCGTPQEVMDGWMASTGHRNNILSSTLREIGIGYYSGSGSWYHYWTQVFAQTSAYPLIINADSSTTTSSTVRLYVYGSWNEIRLSNDNLNWTAWTAFQNNLTWILAGTGLCTVYAQMRTSGGSTASGSDDINYDPPTILLSVTANLEGGFDKITGQMKTTNPALLPLTAPYALDPATVTQIPANTVDWVLLQLRQSNGVTVVKNRSVFLNSTGGLLDQDGHPTVTLEGVPTGVHYYIVLLHRNHVAVMSSSAISMNDGVLASWDFTSGAAQYYGSNTSRQYGSEWCIPAGDINQDKSVGLNDFNAWQTSARLPAEGYQAYDLNLNGLATTEDYVLWFNNYRLGITSSVP